MKAFWRVLKKYVTPYRHYLAGSVVLNILSAVLNIFSFSLIIPILQMLFNLLKLHELDATKQECQLPAKISTELQLHQYPEL